MRIYVTNLDSKDIYPENTTTHFRVKLPQHLEGNWQCGMSYCNLPDRPTELLFVTADFIESSIAGGKYMPVLSFMSAKAKEYTQMSYVDVKSSSIQTMTFKVVNGQGERVQLPDGVTVIILDFKPKWLQ